MRSCSTQFSITGTKNVIRYPRVFGFGYLLLFLYHSMTDGTPKMKAVVLPKQRTDCSSLNNAYFSPSHQIDIARSRSHSQFFILGCNIPLVPVSRKDRRSDSRKLRLSAQDGCFLRRSHRHRSVKCNSVHLSPEKSRKKIFFCFSLPRATVRESVLVIYNITKRWPDSICSHCDIHCSWPKDASRIGYTSNCIFFRFFRKPVQNGF